MKNKIYLMLSVFLLIFTLSGVDAQTPFDAPVGVSQYVIEFPQLNTAYLNQPFQFNSHVYKNDGVALKSVEVIDNVSCHIDGHDFTGNVTIHLDLNNTHNGNFNVEVPSTFFNWVGNGYYSMHCSDNDGLVGIISQPFIVVRDLPVVEDGKLNLNLEDPITLIILGLIILSIVLLVFFKQFMFSGFLTLILGFIFLFSTGNYLLSTFIILIGLGQIFANK